jgi:hypothetical protein
MSGVGSSLMSGVGSSLDGEQGVRRDELAMEIAVCRQPLRFPRTVDGGSADVLDGGTHPDGAAANGVAEDKHAAGADEPSAMRPSRAARQLLCRMLTKMPEARLTLGAIACDAWLTDGGRLAPVELPVAGAPLEATRDEIHHAISMRAPALDLAGGPPIDVTRTSHQAATPLVAADRTRSMPLRGTLSFPVRHR